MCKTISSILFVFVCVFFSGCAERKNVSPMPSIDKDTKQQLAKPVNCGTAERDIAILEKEKASVGKQLLAGARSVMPVAAVAGILMGDYSDRAKVAVGAYNSDIESKIGEIRQTCGIRSRTRG